MENDLALRQIIIRRIEIDRQDCDEANYPYDEPTEVEIEAMLQGLSEVVDEYLTDQLN